MSLATTPDVRSGVFKGDTLLCGAHLCGVTQRIVARAAPHLGFDRRKATASCGFYAVVPVSEEQPLFFCAENDDGRENIEHLGVSYCFSSGREG